MARVEAIDPIERRRLSVEGAQDVTRALLQWVSDALPGAPVAAVPLHTQTFEEGVAVRLLNIGPKRPTQSAAPGPVLRLDYLLTVHMADPIEAHRSLGELCMSAMADPVSELDADTGVAELLTRLGLAPAPGLLLRRHFSRMPAAARIDRVRFPLEVRLGELRQIEGLVLGPKNMPIYGARVAVAGETNGVATDSAGRFRLTAAATGAVRITAQAHGAVCEALSADRGPTILRLPLET